MVDSFIRSSGTEVFNGNQIGLQAKKYSWTFGRLTNAPEKPGLFSFPEQMSVGIKAPTLNIQGIFDATLPHSSSETGSTIDYYFLNELVLASGPKYFMDDYVKPSSGSELLVEIIQWNMTMDAKDSEARDIKPTAQNYNLNLVVISGTPLFSGTGIILP